MLLYMYATLSSPTRRIMGRFTTLEHAMQEATAAASAGAGAMVSQYFVVHLHPVHVPLLLNGELKQASLHTWYNHSAPYAATVGNAPALWPCPTIHSHPCPPISFYPPTLHPSSCRRSRPLPASGGCVRQPLPAQIRVLRVRPAAPRSEGQQRLRLGPRPRAAPPGPHRPQLPVP